MTQYHAVDAHGQKIRTFDTHAAALDYTGQRDLRALSDHAYDEMHGR